MSVQLRQTLNTRRGVQSSGHGCFPHPQPCGLTDCSLPSDPLLVPESFIPCLCARCHPGLDRCMAESLAGAPLLP